MKIATICSNEYTAPPPSNTIHASLYISSIIAEGLTAKGHDVVFFCAQGSQVKTKKIFPDTKPFFEVVSKDSWDNLLDMRLRAQLITPFDNDLYLKLLEYLSREKFDLVHFHGPLIFLGPYASRTNLPNIITIHDNGTMLENTIVDTFKNTNNYFISISKNQRTHYPSLNFFGTIYHGVNTKKIVFNDKPSTNMVFASRLIKQKGVKEAIAVAIQTRKKLIISGQVRASQKEYFENEVKPLIERHNEFVELKNFVDHSLINDFFKQGKLFLFPLQWDEPFGLVLIESMASGTPVIAFAKGSVPEIIKDGETGFIINPSDDDIRGDWIIKKTGIEGLCEAVERIYSMPEEEYRQMRRTCREHVEKHFTVERMVDEYETIYKQILKQ